MLIGRVPTVPLEIRSGPCVTPLANVCAGEPASIQKSPLFSLIDKSYVPGPNVSPVNRVISTPGVLLFVETLNVSSKFPLVAPVPSLFERYAVPVDWLGESRFQSRLDCHIVECSGLRPGNRQKSLRFILHLIPLAQR